MSPTRVVVAVAAGLVLWATTPVAAYVLEKTDDGVLITWPQTCVDWWMQVDGSTDIGPDSSLEVVTTSVATWDFEESHYMDFWERGVTCTDLVGFAGPGGQQNVVMWRDVEWPYADRVVGLTSLSFEPDTGFLADADIELNGADYKFGMDGAADSYDVQQAVTHEVGHVLGLGHSELEAAVMYASAGPGAVDKRTLHADDIAGIAASHPADSPPEETGGCDLTAEPTTFAEPFCPAPIEGCQGGSGPPLGWPTAAAIALLFALRPRRRRPRLRGALLIAAMSAAVLAFVAPPAGAMPPAGCNAYLASISGEPIYWPIRDIDITPDGDVGQGVDPDRFHDILVESFAEWTDIECLQRTATVEPLGACPGEASDDGINCIYWEPEVTEWEQSTWGTGLVAITLVHHYPDTGVIADTDLAINLTGDYVWSDGLECDPADDVHHDLLATLTHEAGHFFGLDHSEFIQSTMHGFTFPGDCTKRGVHQVDIDCTCWVYDEHPPEDPEAAPEVGGDTAMSDASPGSDASDDDAVTPDTGGGTPRPGCECASAQTSHLAPWLLVALALVATRRRRSLRSRNRARPQRQ